MENTVKHLKGNSKNTAIEWILCDFAGVLAKHQSASATRELEEVAGGTSDSFWTAYWAERDAYDAGSVSAEEYWSRILNQMNRPNSSATLNQLVKLDVSSWLDPDRDTLKVVAALADAGMHLALLSNAPRELAMAVERLDWLSSFEVLIFSCRIGRTKPDPMAFRVALGILKTAPQNVLFVDDRIVNIDGARAIGIPSIHFEGADLFNRDAAQIIGAGPN